MNCPDCAELLNPQAKRCVCGWQNPKYIKVELKPGQRIFDPRCTYEAHGQRCHHPVGFLDTGSNDGWCVFHRNMDPKSQQQHGADIVRDSGSFTREQYLTAAAKLVYGRGLINPAHIALAERAAKVHKALSDKRIFDNAMQEAA